MGGRSSVTVNAWRSRTWRAGCSATRSRSTTSSGSSERRAGAFRGRPAGPQDERRGAEAEDQHADAEEDGDGEPGVDVGAHAGRGQDDDAPQRIASTAPQAMSMEPSSGQRPSPR